MKTYQLLFPLRGKFSIPLSELIEYTEDVLRKIYGTKNLSIIERWHLKRCCEKTGELLQAQWEQVNYNPKYLGTIPTPHEEAAWMWVEEVTRISADVLKPILHKYGCLLGPLNTYLLISRVRAHNIPHEEALTGISKRMGPIKL